MNPNELAQTIPSLAAVANRDTIFSPCRQYRYTLWREWWQDNPPRPMCRDCADHNGICPTSRKRCDSTSYLMVVGLNPSTADETKNDPTIRRCIDFARRWGFGALCMTNLFAWRDTKPERMKRASAPVGWVNDEHLVRIAAGAGMILAAWGKHGSHEGRADAVRQLLAPYADKLHYLRLNGDGSPEHPLYVPASTVPALYGA